MPLVVQHNDIGEYWLFFFLTCPRPHTLWPRPRNFSLASLTSLNICSTRAIGISDSSRISSSLVPVIMCSKLALNEI